MGETAGEIRHDIEQTRARMTATLDAIGYKLDIPARMRYRFSHIMHDVADVFSGKPGYGNGGEPGLIADGEPDGRIETTGENAIGQNVQARLSEVKESIVETMTTGTMAGPTPDGTTIAAVSATGAAAEAMKNTAVEATRVIKETAQGTWSSIGRFARDNALVLGAGAFVVGIIAGLFIPRLTGEPETQPAESSHAR